jgi:hypothetical protein
VPDLSLTQWRVVALGVLCAFVALIVIGGIVATPWLFLILAGALVIVIPIFLNQVPYEMQRRRLQARFPKSIALNVRADYAQGEALTTLISIYGSPVWDRRAAFSMQALAADEGLMFWTRRSGSEPVAVVPWNLVERFEAGLSQRGLQSVIKVTVSGIPSFGISPLSPKTYGIALGSDTQLRKEVEALNTFREATLTD